MPPKEEHIIVDPLRDKYLDSYRINTKDEGAACGDPCREPYDLMSNPVRLRTLSHPELRSLAQPQHTQQVSHGYIPANLLINFRF